MSRSFSAPSFVLAATALLIAAGAQASAASAPASSGTAPSTLANGRSVHGMPSAAKPDRVVDLAQAGAGELNIVCGETIQFRNGDKSFAWTFESVGHRAVDLRSLAPAGFTDRPLWVFVERNDGERS
ncbi:CzcE family metal-binding protein [Roseateles chitinivorans]|uniref:CzcE family metal-binding protein n=1 Tax=Roseateles chitinivorans TaxID=2917965 RepID=UPI003D6655BC